MRELNYSILNIFLMMTPDDKSNDGKTHPTLFPARKEIIEFCSDLRSERDVNLIKSLPRRTNSKYEVNLCNGGRHITNQNRKTYFSELLPKGDQLLFLDPDNGFEPEKLFNEKHILYSDLSNIIEQISEVSVISVFQHFRRKYFTKDFARIKERLKIGHATAIYWRFLMFVAISKSEAAIMSVLEANKKYCKGKPIRVIA